MGNFNPDNIHPGSRCGLLGPARVTGLASARIVDPRADSLHRCSNACVKPLHIDSDMLVATASSADRTALKSSQLTRPPPGEWHAISATGHLAACFQKIPDFGQQCFLRGRARCRCRFLEAVDLLDHDEEAKSNNQKFNNRVNEHSIRQNGNSLISCLLHGSDMLAVQNKEQVGKINSAEQQTDDGHHDIIHDRSNNFPKCGTNDDTYGQINNVPFESKLFKFLKK